MKIKPKQLNIANGKLVIGSSTTPTETSFTFPASDGSENQVLQTNGSGTVSWATVSGGGGSSYTINVSTLNDANYAPLTYSSSNNEEFYVMTPTADRTITLPNIGTDSIPEGYKVNFKNLSASFSMTIQPNTTSTTNYIDSSSISNHVISVQYQNLTLVCDGNNTWYRV